MRSKWLLPILVLALSASASADDVGAELPLEDQSSVDGWGGIQVRFGEALPVGQAVNTVRYYADDDRTEPVENGDFRLVPLIVKQEDGGLDGSGTFTVFDVGPVHIPEEGGAQEFDWLPQSLVVPADDSLYHVGVLEWPQDAANNDAGGLVSFGEDGSGMHFFDVDTSTLTPEDLGPVEVGYDLTNDSPQIHTSAAGGRDYQINFGTGAPADIVIGDFNDDQVVDLADYQILVANYNMEVGDPGTNGDIDFNSQVNFADFVSFRQTFSEAAGAAAVPEPIAGLLSVIGALGTTHFLRRRRD